MSDEATNREWLEATAEPTGMATAGALHASVVVREHDAAEFNRRVIELFDRLEREGHRLVHASTSVLFLPWGTGITFYCHIVSRRPERPSG